MQDVFNLRKLLINEGFQLCEREARLHVGQPLQQVGKDTFGIGDIGQSVLAADSFFNHRDQMVSNFRRGRQHGRNLPLPGIALQNIGNSQKAFCICH